jgi:hypothetical protein
MELPVRLVFRSSGQSVLRRITNFGNGALALSAAAAVLNSVFTRVVNHCVTVWDYRATCFARLWTGG